jgi:hydroxymethylpyrimidine kinase/phosphomethylpyrimidine kinase
MVIPCVLTVAASDSSGAAGLQADLKTFEARQVYGLSALTAITAQNSQTIEAVQIMPPEFVAQQIATVLSDITINVVKMGLLLRAEIIEAVVVALGNAETPPENLIIDPVLVNGYGDCLVDDVTIAAYIEQLFPHALIITPNIDEAMILTGLTIDDAETMFEAAQILHDMGPRHVLIKGGHLNGADKALDVLYDGTNCRELRAVRVPVNNVRGAGCTYASCIAAEVAKGHDMFTAVAVAKKYLTVALTAAAGWRLGKGRGTIFHSTGRPPLFSNVSEIEGMP